MLDQLRDNLAAVRSEIAMACASADRGVDEVRLICVTKYADWSWVEGLYELGERHFGESRPQQLAERVPRINDDVHWHLVGTLQANKVRSAIQNAHTIHSVESSKLLARIDRIADELERTTELFLQINIANESAKHGWSVDAFQEELPKLPSPTHARIAGLMTMAPRVEQEHEAAPFFERLRDLRDELAPKWSSLSMGMSGDFRAAIHAGATHIRVGSRLYRGLNRTE